MFHFQKTTASLMDSKPTTRIINLHQPSSPPEIFVVVKPPAGTANPLDLQIQLLTLPSSSSNSIQQSGLGANVISTGGGRSRSSSVNSRVSLDNNGVSENKEVNISVMITLRNKYNMNSTN